MTPSFFAGHEFLLCSVSETYPRIQSCTSPPYVNTSTGRSTPLCLPAISAVLAAFLKAAREAFFTAKSSRK